MHNMFYFIVSNIVRIDRKETPEINKKIPQTTSWLRKVSQIKNSISLINVNKEANVDSSQIA